MKPNLVSLRKRARQSPGRCVRLVIDHLLATHATSAKLIAAELTEELPAAEAVSVLKALFRDGDSDVRYGVVEQLARYSDSFSRGLLIRALKDPDHLVRANAAESAGLRRDPQFARALSVALRDCDPLVRGAAAVALGGCGDSKTARLLKRRLSQEGNRQVRLSLVSALWLLGSASHFEDVARFLNDGDYRNRCAAANLLSNARGNFVVPARAALARRLGKERSRAVRSSIEGALKAISPRRKRVELGATVQTK
jgi:hypothetical protein